MTIKEFINNGYYIKAIWTMDESHEFDIKKLTNPHNDLDNCVGNIIDTYPDNDTTQCYVYDKDGNNLTDNYDYGLTTKQDLLNFIHNLPTPKKENN